VSITAARTSPTAPPPQPFPAAAIEAFCRELGDAVIGAQIPNLIAPLKVSEDPASRSGTKWKRLFNVVVTAQNRQQDGRPMIRLISEIMRPVRFDSVEGFSAHRHSLNGRLLLYGYEIRDDGRVGRVAVASTLAEAQQRANELHSELSRRNVHADVLAFCRTELLQQNYFHAVLEAAKSVADKIRARTGFNLDGNRLAEAAFSLTAGNPALAFNALSTEWERSEHVGLATLTRGLFGTFRNPTAHAPLVRWALELSEALDMLTLASMLHRRLDGATITPTAPAFQGATQGT
jgi:uncharacterized protein (TIGR02391 family)